ncbi:MAG: thiamine phosphate synthase [Terriglobia bacterium]|nr:thiamine phosphate synthase [Terriglobia bacterium]
MLYAITDRRLYAESEASARVRLLELAAEWAASGVAFIQLREKDLTAREQVELARAMLMTISSVGWRSAGDGLFAGRVRSVAAGHGSQATRLLVNGRADVALAAGADGVHLPAGQDALTPEEVRRIFAAAERVQPPIISVSCHTMQEVETARRQSADCILFAPVFEKVLRERGMAATGGASPVLPGAGLEVLQQACRAAAPVPVFALGGVTAENAADCIRAGAVGVAAIRLLQERSSVWEQLV